MRVAWREAMSTVTVPSNFFFFDVSFRYTHSNVRLDMVVQRAAAAAGVRRRARERSHGKLRCEIEAVWGERERGDG